MRYDPNKPWTWEEGEAFTDLSPELPYPVIYVCGTPDHRAVRTGGYEIIYILEGRLRVCIEREWLEGGAGDVFVVQPHQTHAEEAPSGCSPEILYLPANFRGPSGQRRRFLMSLARHLHLGRGNAVEGRLRQIITEHQHRAPGYTVLVRAAILAVFCELGRATRRIIVPAAELYTASLTNQGQRMQSYIRQNYAMPLTVGRMAAHFHLSRTHFCRLFRAATGQTPHAFLVEVRIQQAKIFLLQTALPVKDVAVCAGFDDPFHFSRTFRNYTGVTPSRYRKQRGDLS